MVFQIELSDENGEHIELATDGTVRLFGRAMWDEKNGAFTVSERQLGLLTAMIEARDALAANARLLAGGKR